MIARAVVLSVLITCAGVLGVRGAGTEQPVTRTSLTTFPLTIGSWTAAGDVPLDGEIVRVLGVDDYVSRTYINAAGEHANLYVGYYASQRQGDTIHSPQNCLPGAGWQPVESARTSLVVGGATLPVNRYVIEKGPERQVVLYWYQGRGRVVANEYANKLWLMVDAARLRRTNGSLVRIIAPRERAAIDFARAVYPRLPEYLP
jgi:EpsI family protein